MGATEVTRFLTWLATDGKVAASTQNQALNAVVRARRPQHLPVVLTRDEVRAVLGRLDGTPHLMAVLLYGAGLRLLECAHLRVKDVDFTAKPSPACYATSSPCGASTKTIFRAARAGWKCRTRWRGSIRTPRVGLAMGISRHPDLHRSDHPPAPPPPPARVGAAARRQESPADCRHREARELPHVPSLIRDASAGRRSRHPDRSGAAGTPRRGDNDDLHARPEPRAVHRPQPGGSAARLLTGSPCYTAIRCSLSRRRRNRRRVLSEWHFGRIALSTAKRPALLHCSGCSVHFAIRNRLIRVRRTAGHVH